ISSKDKKRKIKEATVISQVLTSCLAVEEDYVIGFQKKCLIGLDLPHNDTLVISIQMDMDAKINKFAKSLTSFNGATSVTLGTINLDVYSSLLISSQTFMIVEVISLHWHFGYTMDLQVQCNHFCHTPEHTLPSSFLHPLEQLLSRMSPHPTCKSSKNICLVESDWGKQVVQSVFGIVKYGGVTPINLGKSRPPP
ncbi:unnamed protein product, partial [Prunus brigantina]